MINAEVCKKERGKFKKHKKRNYFPNTSFDVEGFNKFNNLQISFP